MAATVPVMGWGNYWRDVCAPKLRQRKKELGRDVPEVEIAGYVAEKSGKRSERALVNLWLLGKREPYISQFLALCDRMGLDPHDVLRSNNRNSQRAGIKTHREGVIYPQPRERGKKIR